MEVSSYIDRLKQFDAAGKQAAVAEEDAHWQVQMVAAQNRLVPNLNLRVFNLSDDSSSEFRQAVLNTAPGTRWRALVNIDRGFGPGMPRHVVAVEVAGRRGSPSVVAIDSLWACPETQRILPKALESTGASLKLINTAMQKGPVGCAVFALEVAKEMTESEKLLRKFHANNGKGEDLDENGIKLEVANGQLTLPANFFIHTTSKNVLQDLPAATREKVERHFNEHLKQREDAKGKTVTYSNSIEEVRIRIMDEVLRAAESS